MSFFEKIYGLACPVVAFTGDNPSALIGCGAVGDSIDCVISLGTSDTIFCHLQDELPRNSNEIHIFRSPFDDNRFMGMGCYRNGSLTRESLKGELSWSDIGDKLMKPKESWLNDCDFSMFYKFTEINPSLGPDFDKQFSNFEESPLEWDPLRKMYAVVTGQIIAKRAHLVENLGIDISMISRLIATGGASKNLGILQIISNVFQIPVEILDSSEAAALGGALKAIYTLEGKVIKDTTGYG